MRGPLSALVEQECQLPIGPHRLTYRRFLSVQWKARFLPVILVLLKNHYLLNISSHENVVLATLPLCSKLATLTLAATLATLAVVMCVCVCPKKKQWGKEAQLGANQSCIYQWLSYWLAIASVSTIVYNSRLLHEEGSKQKCQIRIW